MKNRWALVGAFAPLLTACQVTGANPSDDATYHNTQSETSMNVSVTAGTTFVTVGYNQLLTDPPFQKRPTFGWSTWDSVGKAWTHHDDYALPDDWNSRTDNAMTSVPGYPQYVYAGFLAFRLSDPAQQTGVCVLKSSDSGVTFQTWGCFKSTRGLDGVSLAARGGNPAQVYAAMLNFNDQRTEVWSATTTPTSSTAFAQVPGDPFPGEKINTHARARMDAFANLWVAAVTQDARLLMNGYNTVSHQWGTVKQIATGVINFNEPDIRMANDANLSMGPSFSFEIGYGDQTGISQMRVAYTKKTPDATLAGGFRYYVAVARCNSFESTCTELWSSNGVGDRVRPIIAWTGGFLARNTWALSYQSRELDPTGYTVSVWGGTLNENGGFLPAMLVGPEYVCEGGTGFGDYDDMRFLYTDTSNVDHFLRAYTDSHLWGGTSPQPCATLSDLAHLHVSVTGF